MGDAMAFRPGGPQSGAKTPNIIARGSQADSASCKQDAGGHPSLSMNPYPAAGQTGASFHSQFDRLSPQNPQAVLQTLPHYLKQAFSSPTSRMDMTSLANALPDGAVSLTGSGLSHGAVPFQGPPYSPQSQVPQFPIETYAPYGQGQDQTGSGASSVYYQQPQHPRYPSAPQYVPYGPQFPISAGNVRAGAMPATYPALYGDNMTRSQIPPYSSVDPRAFVPFPAAGLAMVPEYSGRHQGQRFARPSTDAGPTPSYPRGPPRKPKQSGHTLGDATNDIESVFLISKSNCAFVNCRIESACAAPIDRFHDSRFHGVRLVCRFRRRSVAVAKNPILGSNDATHTPLSDMSQSKDLVETHLTSANPSPAKDGIEKIDHVDGDGVDGAHVDDAHADGVSDMVPEKYFIVKSLTMQDLEVSVRNQVWATQSHNEKTLNKAFETAHNVYLIFSVNKSGIYFGYTRMGSAIEGRTVTANPVAAQESAEPYDGLKSISTPATEWAPKGRVIDNSPRGTIFWEADDLDDDQESSQSPVKDATSPYPSNGQSQDWGKPFATQWISTNRLPFYRTRGLRNSWNANREVKIARDGTELEPSVGKRLVQMFHQVGPAPGPSGLSGSSNQHANRVPIVARLSAHESPY